MTDQNQEPSLEQLWSVEGIGIESHKSNSTFPQEQERCGFIEQVADTSARPVHYLSHHPVKKDSPTTPIRIVYDCSCRENPRAASLKDCLMVEPPFLNDLCTILLRFRLHNYGLFTDVEKAFLHVKLHETDRDFTQFLWPLQPEHPDSTIQVFRFTSAPFGTASLPFILHATINLHLHKYQSSIAEDIQRNIYVDNIISGVDSEAQLMQYYTQAKHMMSQANFNLRSWASNCTSLQQIATIDKCIDTNTTVHVLGLLWNTLTDILSLAPKSLPLSNIVSKRNILQDSAQIFDPLGWTTPIKIHAKILLQDKWQRKCSWDVPLDDDITNRWLDIRSDILELPNLPLPRSYFPNQISRVIDHIFTCLQMPALRHISSQ